MPLNLKLIKFIGATRSSNYSNIRRQPRMDIEQMLSTGDSGFSQFLREGRVYVKKRLKELEDETRYAKFSD